MKANSSLSLLFPVVLFVLASGCNDDSPATPEIPKLSWMQSEFSLPDGFSVVKAKVLDGLYVLGVDRSRLTIEKLMDDGWKEVAVFDENAIFDFTFYHDTLYYVTPTSLKRTRGDFAESILEGELSAVAVFKNQLIVTARSAQFNGNPYNIIAYDGKTFTPIYSGDSSGKMVEANGKLYIEGNTTKVYDGNTVDISKYPGGGFLNVDSNEAIYTWMEWDDKFSVRTFQSDKYQDIGDVIYSTSILNELEFYQGTTVISAIDAKTNISGTYYLGTSNRWIEISKIQYPVLDLANYDGRLFAFTWSRVVLELTDIK